MANRQTVFEFFRYQLLPKNSQITLFETSPMTVSELKQRKNEFFKDAVLNNEMTIYDSFKDELIYKILGVDENKIALKLGKKKSIVLTNELLEDEEHSDFPYVLVLIDNDPNKQIIAVSVDVDAFSNSFVVANLLETNFSRICSKYNLEVVVNPILDEHDFWKLISKYQARITQLKFNLIRPNMANISGSFKDEIRELTDSTNSLITKVELNAPKDSVLEHINEGNERVKALADYAIKGGSQYIHMKVKGIKKTIKTEKTISKTSIDNLELSGDPSIVMDTYNKITNQID